MVAEANIGADDSDAAALQGMKVFWSQSVSHQRSISKRTKDCPGVCDEEATPDTVQSVLGTRYLLHSAEAVTT